MELSIPDKSFLDSFELLKSLNLDEFGEDRLNLFMIRINAKEFDYNLLIENLLEPIITYSVSRKVKKEYANRPHALVRKALSHFIQNSRSGGELGELLLYAFLECHLNAPKILTKLELKTSSSMYVHGSDGVHYLRLPNGDYQLIFGESKLYKDIVDAIYEALQSIYFFKSEMNQKGDRKSGIVYEKSLISDNLCKEYLSQSDADFIKSIIYPRHTNAFCVDDAFGIFIGYETNISTEMKRKPRDLFCRELKAQIINEVESKLSGLLQQIEKRGLAGHSFYVYIVPFTDLDKSRKEVMERLLSGGAV